MLSHDAVGHEEAEAGASLLGGEVRFEQVVALGVGDTRSVVGNGHVGPSIAALSGGDLNTPTLTDGIDGVVQEVGDHLAHEKRVSADLYLIGRFAYSELDLFGAGPRACHSDGASRKLIEV